MTISAKIIAHSISPYHDIPLITWVLRYHRFVHAELMTHRQFSRNASSSRAIPVSKMIQWTKEDPAVPVEWGKNVSGMQAKELLDAETAAKAELVWLEARDDAIKHTERLLELGVHKQIANRVLEPWHHIAVVLSGTDFANWFTLRDHKDAQPEIRALAAEMREQFLASVPKLLHDGEWHLPFIRETEMAENTQSDLLKMSVARCARVSYMNHDGSNPDKAKDIALHDMLVVAKPLHASPAEHQATTMPHGYDEYAACGNFRRGWRQYRKTLPGECATTYPWDNK